MRVKVQKIGAMGWLQSCRFNFREGSSILYGENVLDIRTETLRLGVSQYIPGRQLSNVTSVEWRLEPLFMAVGLSDDRHKVSGPDQLLALERQLRAIFAAMPNLRTLYFGLPGNAWFWDTERDWDNPEPFNRLFQRYMQDVFPLLDRLVQELSDRNITLEFGVPKSVFIPCFMIGRAKGFKSQHRMIDCNNALPGICHEKQHALRQRIWRPAMDLAERAPEDAGADEHMRTGSTQKDTGYWISGTDWDLPDTFWTNSSYSDLRGGRGGVDELERAWNSPGGQI